MLDFSQLEQISIEGYARRLMEFGLYVAKSGGRNGGVYGYSPVLDFAAEEHGIDAARGILDRAMPDLMRRDYLGDLAKWKRSGMADSKRHYREFHRAYDGYGEVEVRVNGGSLRLRKRAPDPARYPMGHTSGIG